jgi:hypothetical protein
VILEQIHAIPGVQATSTSIAVLAFPEDEERADTFSTWS